jgi:hypothetical protein
VNILVGEKLDGVLLVLINARVRNSDALMLHWFQRPLVINNDSKWYGLQHLRLRGQFESSPSN